MPVHNFKFPPDIGAGEELCWIMDQPGSRTYTVASVSGGGTPDRTGSC